MYSMLALIIYFLILITLLLYLYINDKKTNKKILDLKKEAELLHKMIFNNKNNYNDNEDNLK